MTEEELWYKFDLIFHGVYWGRVKSYKKIDPERNILEVKLIDESTLHFAYVDNTSWALYFDARQNDYRV